MQKNVAYPTFLYWQSDKQHNKLKTDIYNNFTTGENWHPKTRQANLQFRGKYIKSVIAAPLTYEGAAFSQNGGNKCKVVDKNTYD